MDRRRILEVGPGIRPLHHRSKGAEGLELHDDEEYVGLDQPHAIEDMSDHEVWKQAKERYGERAHIISGNRANMDGISDGSFDELVCLGAHGSATDGTMMEFDRVLRPGGILRLGIGSPRLPALMESWGVQLKQLGYVEMANEQLDYNQPDSESPYTVVSFRKKPNS